MAPETVVARRQAEPPARPGRFVDDYLPALLAQASELISAEFHRVVRKHGLSVTEWRVLATLAGGAPISIGKLAQVTVSKQPTVTRLLDRMEARGPAARRPGGRARRVTRVGVNGGAGGLPGVPVVEPTAVPLRRMV